MKSGTSRPWTVPRTPDGRPDLQGIWTNTTLTPLERPRSLADRAFLTESEATAIEAQAAGRQTAADTPEARQQAQARGDIGSYSTPGPRRWAPWQTTGITGTPPPWGVVSFSEQACCRWSASGIGRRAAMFG